MNSSRKERLRALAEQARERWDALYSRYLISTEPLDRIRLSTRAVTIGMRAASLRAQALTEAGSHHWPSLAAAAVAPCDKCGKPARPKRDDAFQAYRQTKGFVFLCASCVPAHHEAYAATRVSQPFRAARDRRSTW
jgi:hypothetical protein